MQTSRHWQCSIVYAFCLTVPQQTIYCPRGETGYWCCWCCWPREGERWRATGTEVVVGCLLSMSVSPSTGQRLSLWTCTIVVSIPPAHSGSCSSPPPPLPPRFKRGLNFTDTPWDPTSSSPMQYYFQISPLCAFHACLPPPDSFPKSSIIAALQTSPACDVIRRQTVEVEDMKRDGQHRWCWVLSEATEGSYFLQKMTKKKRKKGGGGAEIAPSGRVSLRSECFIFCHPVGNLSCFFVFLLIRCLKRLTLCDNA